MEFVTLNNGVTMPSVGYGVFQVDPAETERCVLDAIAVGYRSIDTAQGYGNEEGVGAAIAKCGLPRDQLFLTTKIAMGRRDQQDAAASIDASLRKLGVDYVDLFLVHQPFNDYYAFYRALEDALKAGKARAIGVSNFYPDRLADLCIFQDIIPAVDQNETHVFYQQKPTRAVCREYGVVLEAWAPLGQGKNGLLDDPTLTQVAAHYGKTPAQTALRFLVQQGIVVIPKSTHRERMAENIDLFDFTLTAEDMAALEALDRGESSFQSHYDPAKVTRLSRGVGRR